MTVWDLSMPEPFWKLATMVAGRAAPSVADADSASEPLRSVTKTTAARAPHIAKENPARAIMSPPEVYHLRCCKFIAASKAFCVGTNRHKNCGADFVRRSPFAGVLQTRAVTDPLTLDCHQGKATIGV